LKLSTKGLENAGSLAIKDFHLRIGNHTFECSRFEATFLSPPITSALLSDPTIEEYDLGLEIGDSFDCDSMRRLLSLARNGSFEVTDSNFEFVKCVVRSLGNRELTEGLMAFANARGDLNHSIVFEGLALAQFLDVSAAAEIDYVACHFYELDGQCFRCLSEDTLREILGSEKLRLYSEDSLLDFVIELGHGYFYLLGFVRSEYLSFLGIDRLLKSISLNDVDESLWASLCCRLRLSTYPSVLQESRFHPKPFPLDAARPFDGILSRFARECGGNVHTEGIIAITASGNSHNRCHQVADYTWTDYWSANTEGSQWIQFDFNRGRISVTDYTMKSGVYSSSHLSRWSLDGSNDGKSWINLDRRNTEDLHGHYVVKSYRCESHQSASSFFRFIRLTETGTSATNGSKLVLSNLEFFGAVSGL
jgi:hypothetical protein